jgi:hypothetical protein
MSAKHTPGPWVAIFPESRVFHESADITHYDVMTEKTRDQLLGEGLVHYCDDPHSVDNVSIVSCHFWRDMLDEEAKANARLIAAAPDLLQALKFITEDVCDRFDMNDSSTNPGMKLAVKLARAAIAKATGEKL